MTERPARRTPTYRWIYLQDEIPKIGCGWRYVEITSIGPKWCRLKDPDYPLQQRSRIRRKVWDAIVNSKRNRAGRHPLFG